MEDIGSAQEGLSRCLKKMYMHRCVRKPGYVVQFTGIKDDLYQCTQCKRARIMRSTTIVDKAVVPGKQHPEDGHHESCRPLPEAGKKPKQWNIPVYVHVNEKEIKRISNVRESAKNRRYYTLYYTLRMLFALANAPTKHGMPPPAISSNLVYGWRTTTRISHRRHDLQVQGQRSMSQGHVICFSHLGPVH